MGFYFTKQNEGWNFSKYKTICWFPGLEISENGILVCKDFNGRPSGEAYVQLNSVIEAEKALEKNNANMGHRWGAVLTFSFRVGRVWAGVVGWTIYVVGSWKHLGGIKKW